MKKIITPFVAEQSVYYSDFTGKCFGNFKPNVSLTIHFNYGSKYDGTSIELDLSDEDFGHILNVIKNNISTESKIKIAKLSNDQ